jgi:cytochrome c
VKRVLFLACAVLPAAQAFFPVALAADAGRGKQLYESRCIGCHSIDENRVGPAHRGVFGRKAGAAKGFDFSPALKASRMIWNEKTLDRWLTNPEATIPGQRMGFSVPKAADRADIIEYLRTAK